jgi:uncharacterized membrane protein
MATETRAEANERRGWSDERVDALLGTLLRVGVLLSAAIVAAGGVLYLFKYGGTTPAYGDFRGEPADLRSVGGIVRAALELRGRGLIQLGLLVLIATPVARVAFSLFAFARQRDRTYVLVTAFVLLLVASLTGVIG